MSQLQDVLDPAQLAGLRQSLSAVETFSAAQKGAVVGGFADAFEVQLRVGTGIAGGSLGVCLAGWQRVFPGCENWEGGAALVDGDGGRKRPAK